MAVTLAAAPYGRPASCHHRRVRRRGLYPRLLPLPAMPHDKDAADAMAATHLDGAHADAALSAAALRWVRRPASLGQAVATGR